MNLVANPDRRSDQAHDDKLVALVRAIAYELMQMGYRPSAKPGHVLMEGASRDVAIEIWAAMGDIQAGGAP
jgi:hypothetical protein